MTWCLIELLDMLPGHINHDIHLVVIKCKMISSNFIRFSRVKKFLTFSKATPKIQVASCSLHSKSGRLNLLRSCRCTADSSFNEVRFSVIRTSARCTTVLVHVATGLLNIRWRSQINERKSFLSRVADIYTGQCLYRQRSATGVGTSQAVLTYAEPI